MSESLKAHLIKPIDLQRDLDIFIKEFQDKYGTDIPLSPLDPLYQIAARFIYEKMLLYQRINVSGLKILDRIGEIEAQKEKFFGQRKYYRNLVLAISYDHKKKKEDGTEYILTERVADASIYHAPKGVIKVWLRSDSVDGLASDELKKTVIDTLNDDSKKCLNDTFDVQNVISHEVKIKASLWIQGNEIQSIEKIQEEFIKLYNQEKNLGDILPISWIYANLHGQGVKKVVLEYTPPVEKIEPNMWFYVTKNSVKLTKANIDELSP